ncbi:MAG TPA: non-homologous end-joining DNA ligase [Candidatus Eisenbacteria bacterium]|nr:non-homologous end-joining DNA ligase [Candidatus Eisenbacteria bacterium]
MPKKNRVTVAGRELELSNLEKPMYPEVGFTKGQVIDYYRRVSRFILPHIQDRPITLKRYPNGVTGQHFYEKNAPSFTPKWIKTFPVKRVTGRSIIRYILINDLPSLLWSANTANLEIHPFLAKAPDIATPTMVIFDLDPGEGADILRACEAAFLVKAILDRLKLKSLVKVSGSKGIHLHVPLNTQVTYAATQAFAKSIAQTLEREHSDWLVSEMPKAKRRGKVFVDWSQNSAYKSTVAVYSLRAKRERPFVAMPVTWEELQKILNEGDAARLFFEPEAALERLKKSGDSFAPMLKLKQRLPVAFSNLPGGNAPEGSGERGDPLDAYRRKRDFRKTPEPPPIVHESSAADAERLFVVQKHAARQLHYDLRFEMNGVLKSWAVPKGPPYELNEKRLAMATEDHPMDYARFEGTIPPGEYGGGTVMVWDIGTYRLLDGNYWKGKLDVRLKGKKLNGEWTLVKAGPRDDGKRNSWLWIKTGSSMNDVDALTRETSALTGRSLEEIARAGDAVWHSNRGVRAKTERLSPPKPSFDLESLPRAPIAFIEPMLATPVSRLPEDTRQWIYEIKLDGYRCLALRVDAGVKLFSRKRNLLNKRFPMIAEALQGLPAGSMTDGEIVALDESGRPSFNILQNENPSGARIYYYVFDLLSWSGKSLLKVGLEDRRELLRASMERLPGRVRFSADFSGSPATIAAAAKELGVEGIIAKKKGSLYEPGERSGAWVKYRIHQGQEFVIGGYLPGPHGFDFLLVGYYESDKLIFLAKIRNGFVPRVRREIFARLKGLEIAECPFANLPEPKGARRGKALTAEVMKECVWVKPKLIAQVEFAEWTAGNHLRHARFAGLRDDKDARAVRREYPPERGAERRDLS